MMEEVAWQRKVADELIFIPVNEADKYLLLQMLGNKDLVIFTTCCLCLLLGINLSFMIRKFAPVL